MNGWSSDYERGHFDGTHQERERIIALLEELLDYDNGEKYCYECGNWSNIKPDAIALINGEQK